GALRIAVGIDDASTLTHRARPPDRGIADGRTHLEDRLRAADNSELIKHACYGGSDDGDVVLARLIFHLGENCVSRRQHGVKIIFDLRNRNSTHAPVRLRGLIRHLAPWCSAARCPRVAPASRRHQDTAPAGIPVPPPVSAIYEIVCPGFISTTSTLGTNFCNSAGVPVNIGNVPKCIGMTVSGCSNLQAYAASRGDIVKW